MFPETTAVVLHCGQSTGEGEDVTGKQNYLEVVQQSSAEGFITLLCLSGLGKE